MSRVSRRLAIVVVALFAVGAGAAVAAPHHRTTHRRYTGLSLRRIRSANHGTGRARVIVLLRNQYASLPPDRFHAAARTAAVRGAESPVETAVRRAGGRVTHSYRVIDGFAATVTAAQRSRLAADPAVARIVPDASVPNPASGAGGLVYNDKPMARRAHSAAAAPATTAPDGQPICPSDPSKPLLEPEALSIINAPQAQQTVTGAGVKVAFVADGLDPNNPDFIRPDGSHVIVDYRDFSGDGPNAPTSGAEAFGDASSIAAQGRVPYDLSKFVNPAHPLPAGCNIIVRGVAPGASLVAMKVFGDSSNAFISTIIQGMDWAVAVDHVNVLNESFGGDQLPDTTQDVTKQFNRLAIAAGTVVTVSSGDQGTANTIGSPASDPNGELSVAATTQFQHFAQTDRGGYQLSPDGWLNENIANFSSGGFTQLGGTVDLAAPGNESYAACTANTAIYQDCTNFAGQPSNVRTFGGTSESSPLTAGVAALVIQAYRQTHRGSSPSPALVKQIITSTAHDLNIPSYEQGAGELNALAAVKAAESVNGGTATGQQRLVSPSQLDLTAPQGAASGGTVRLANIGSATETYSSSLRRLSGALATNNGNATLAPGSDPTFLDQTAVAQAYTKVTFQVPAGADRIDAAIAWPGPSTTVNMTLFDPSGKMAAFTYMANGEVSDYSHIDVRNPTPGTWSAYIFTPATGGDSYAGTVHYSITSSRFIPVGSVSPATVTLAPGASTTLHVSVPAPVPAGDYSRDLQISGSSGYQTVVPVVMRSLLPLHNGTGSFAGTITGGDGDGAIGREDTFAFNVPGGAPALHLQMQLHDSPATQLIGFLVSPDGQTLGQEESAPSGDGQALQMFLAHPEAGQWKFVVATLSPVSGTTTAAPFTASVSLHEPLVTATGVPHGSTIHAGTSATARITVTNPGNNDVTLFADPRRDQRQWYLLTAITQPTGVTLPLPATSFPPEFLVPTQTDSVLAAAQGSRPITFDWGFGDPDLESTVNGITASGSLSAPEVTPGVWYMAPAMIGPFASSASGTANTGMAGHARVFDADVTSSTGDPQLQFVDPTAPNASPVTIHGGQAATITVTFTPSEAPGSTVRGDLFVDDFQGSGATDEIKAIPYQYRVGRAQH
jgi:hypothetical protein